MSTYTHPAFLQFLLLNLFYHTIASYFSISSIREFILSTGVLLKILYTPFPFYLFCIFLHSVNRVKVEQSKKYIKDICL
jgi:hypothetical protein